MSYFIVSLQRVLAKETQLHLAQKELNKLREQIKSAETTKAQALVELERAQVTAEDLNHKLKFLRVSKDSAIKATETAKDQAKQLEEANSANLSEINVAWKQDLETARAQYTAVITELDAAKQELRKIRQDYDLSTETKLCAFKQESEAKEALEVNSERVMELSREISAAQESVKQVKLASLQAQQEQAKIFSEKDVQRQRYKASLAESVKKLLVLKEEMNPELSKTIESQLAETMNEIDALQKQMENTKASDLDSVRTVTLDLDDAKESLHKVAEEENSLRSLVETLKVELENVKKEHSRLKEKEAETESIAGNLHVKLRKSKVELEACLVEESKSRGASDELISTLTQLSREAEDAQREAEEMKSKAEALKHETEATKTAAKETEEKLQAALQDAEEAKAAEEKAVNQIKSLSEKTEAARVSTSESGANITISKEEYESLSRKVEESDTLAEMKVAAAMAQVKAVKASENEVLKRLETNLKEIEDVKASTNEALRRAEMAEAAKRAVEGELRRWREREQKKAAEAAARILAEETGMKSSPTEASPRHYRIQKQEGGGATTRVLDGRKMEKEKSSVSKKVLLPNISGIFNRRKNQIEGGSPSYLPGEKPL